MSRIAGIVTTNPDFNLTEMLYAQMALACWKSEVLEMGPAKLGHTGANSGCTARNPEVSVILDGTIYNAGALGEGTDAEIILQLYEQNGFTDALNHLNGDFAIALFDSKSGELWLGRDRIGVKPLYYAQTVDGFAFSSRCKSLLQLSGVSREPNRQYVALVAASHYRHFDNQTEKSPYQGIAQLPAASWLRVKDGDQSVGTYWELKDLPDWEDAEENLVERYRELLLDVTRIRMARSTKPGFTLSGGMDSSSVISSAVQVTGDRQEAFSSVYEDKTYDESEDIRTILDHAVSQWHRVEVSNPDVIGLIEKMVAINDEPVATATWLSHYLVCEEAANNGVTHLFGGLGGDELNAGEYEHFFPFFADLKATDQLQLLESEVAKWTEYHDHPIHRKSYAVMEETVGKVCDLSRMGFCRPDRLRLERYHELLNPDYFDLSTFQPVMDHPFESYLKNRCFQDIFRETSPCCLRAQDRQGMAFGIQHVMPFFDHRLVEFMFRVPGTMKFRAGVTKMLLRQAMKKILPDSTRQRIKKTGWNAPAHLWFSGSGQEALLELVHSQSFRERGIYNVEAVIRKIEEHESIVSSDKSEENHMMFLWQLVNLEIWLSALDNQNQK